MTISAASAGPAEHATAQRQYRIVFLIADPLFSPPASSIVVVAPFDAMTSGKPHINLPANAISGCRRGKPSFVAMAQKLPVAWAAMKFQISCDKWATERWTECRSYRESW